MAELAIGRHQKQPFGVIVESADGQKAVGLIGDEVRDRLARLRVGKGGDDFDGLVQNQRGGRLTPADGDAVDRHFVAVRVGLGPQGCDNLVVHRHPTFFDECLRFATGGESGSG